MDNELLNDDRKEKARDGAKSGIKWVWHKLRGRKAADNLKSLVQGMVATTVVGGLAIGGAVGYTSISDKVKGQDSSISVLQAQNAAVGEDLPEIKSDVAEAQAQAATASATSEENTKRIDEVASTIESDSKANDAKIEAVQADLASGKIESADARQEARTALDQASANQNELAEQGKKVDGVAAQVTDLALKEQANAKATGVAQDTADQAVSNARSAATSASEAKTAAATAKATADEALALAQMAVDRLPVYLSITELENQNATVTVGTAPSVTYSFGTATFDGTSRYVFSYGWLRSGFATSCTGGVLLDGSATDPLGKPYPIITPGTPIDDYTSYNYVTRAQIVTPPAGTHTLTFIINEGSCQYSDITLTITKI